MSQDAAGANPEYPAAQNASGVWPPQPLNQYDGGWNSLPPPFSATGPLARWVAGLLIANISLDGLGMIVDPLRSPVGQIVSGVASVLLGLIVIATGVVFLIWAYRSYKNLTAFGATGLRMTPGWLVGYFFIPILSIYRPYTAFKEIWQASTPGLPEDDGQAWKSARISPIVLSWWLLWLLNGISSEVAAFAAQDETPSALSTGLTEGDHLVSIIAAICAIFVVRGITERQEIRWLEITARRAALPSVPPSPGTAWPGWGHS